MTMSMMDLTYTGDAWYGDVVLVNSGNQLVVVKDVLLFIRRTSASPLDHNLRRLEAGEIHVWGHVWCQA